MLLCYALAPTLVTSNLIKLSKTQKGPNVTCCLSNQCSNGSCCTICDLHHVHAGPSSSNWPHLTSSTPWLPLTPPVITTHIISLRKWACSDTGRNVLLPHHASFSSLYLATKTLKLSVLGNQQLVHHDSTSEQSLRGRINYPELFLLLCSRTRNHGGCTGCSNCDDGCICGTLWSCAHHFTQPRRAL